MTSLKQASQAKHHQGAVAAGVGVAGAGNSAVAAASGAGVGAGASQTFNVETFVMAQPALIEASAGTGKTYSITNLVLRALLGVGTRETSLLRPLEVDELLIVTFTNAATADLRLRIYERIRSARLALEEFIAKALNQVVAQLKDPDYGGTLNAQSARIVVAKAQRHKGGAGAEAEGVVLLKQDDAAQYQVLVPEERRAFAENMLELPEEDEHELFLANNYSEEELNGIFVGLNLDELLNHHCTLQDDVTKFIIKELVERSRGSKDSPLRRAVAHLVRAERNINNAAICTIHSFCNSMLTQVYALEAGEAFNTELKLELSDEIHESYYSVWRRLFYQKHSSPLLLRRLAKSDPLAMVRPIQLLNGVRLSSDQLGFYGFQLTGIDELLAQCQCQLDRTQPLEPQLLDYIAQLQQDLIPIGNDLIEVGAAVLETLPYSDFQRLVEPKTGALRQLNAGGNNIALKSNCAELLAQIARCYELLPQARNHGANSVPWSDLVDCLDQIAQKAPVCLGGPNSIFNSRKKAKSEQESACIAQLDRLVQGLSEQLSAVIEQHEALMHQSTQLLRLLTAIVMNQEFERRCKEHHVMSSDDILRRLDYALNLRGRAGASLAHAIRAKYPLAMIDEFQDTDPIQFSIFSSIYLNPQALEQKAYCYLIGDPKQSIYAFRGSDINSYLKARDLIVKLTQHQGIYTLDTNYRSAPDVVAAANAIFGLSLNDNNVNPFNESRISFEEVKSGKAKGLLQQVRAQGQTLTVPTGRECGALSRPWEEGAVVDLEDLGSSGLVVNPRSFYIKDIENLFQYDPDEFAPDRRATHVRLQQAVVSHYPVAQYAALESGAKLGGKQGGELGTSADLDESEILLFSGPANTYVVNVGNIESSSLDDLNWAYARATAKLIERTLKDGRIVDKGVERAVSPGDIAVIVRKGAESDLIREQLWQLQIASVYMSDRSSVLGSEEEPSPESIDLGYLMEAMCDCTNRKKVFRVLGSRLLCLNAQEYQEQCNNDNFEREVKLLASCAQTWKRYGFMPAFLQWASDPRHNVCKRLLALKDGERWYTNYCHIGEIVQGVHAQKSGIQAQLNWYYDLLHHNQAIFDDDVTKKRLESEQDQIKIITIHKSKGLEFPIVFMPFLWRQMAGHANFDTPEKYLSVKRYYDPTKQQVVVDVAPERSFSVKEHLPVYHSSTESFDYGKYRSVPLEVTPDEIIGLEERREAMRLLYVAVTRARYANFIMVGSYQHKKAYTYGDALIEIQGKQGQGYAFDADHEAVINLNSKERMDASAQRFIAHALAHPESFTVLDAAALLTQDDATAPTSAQSSLAEPNSAVAEALREFDARSYNMSELESDQAVPPLAQSFVYKNAIDHSFNIFSYSSLVAGTGYTEELKNANARENTVYGEDQIESDIESDIESEIGLPVTTTKAVPSAGPILVYPMALTPTEPTPVGDESNSVSALMQAKWQQHQYFVAKQPSKYQYTASFKFPCGTDPGKFMHEVLEHVDFEQLKKSEHADCERIKGPGCINYMRDKVLPEMFERMHNQRFQQFDQDNAGESLLTLWFNDVLEAPIIAGRHHCFALADLEPHSYEREMNFLMSNHSFDVDQLNELCAQVAQQLLPDALYAKFKDSLQLKEEKLVGYITGSIDLACCMDLNQRLKLRQRPDLMKLIDQASMQALETKFAALKSELEAGLHPELEDDPELGVMAEPEAPDQKFFVIDYKSNYLGASYDKYDQEHMLAAIYEHRYDVQFLIYSLALYRFLKRRYAVPFDAAYDELKAFYERHIGGVIYLFLRGMQANYRRDRISHGVFSTRLAFDVIYKFDQILSPHD